MSSDTISVTFTVRQPGTRRIDMTVTTALTRAEAATSRAVLAIKESHGEFVQQFLTEAARPLTADEVAGSTEGRRQ